MKENNDKQFLHEVFDLVKNSISHNLGGPFGALIVRDSKIAIREACQKLNTFNLTGCYLYVNCEPCPMCLGACYWARIDKIIFSLTKKDAENIGFKDAYYYEQIRKPLSQRDLVMVQCLREEALPLFEAWDKKKDKVMY
ncbi:nucleoside deaminase [Coxiella burnetii]|uniref:nucleoside deaminase n=1 Tax=Coxiella burnetii TaxID=777 RepID=UPI000CCC0391|nr:nucleoside deaminase [Coxiella burnetii]PNT89781.1 tRNA-specific adenosine deaminase [Coxiella burnetii]